MVGFRRSRHRDLPAAGDGAPDPETPGPAQALRTGSHLGIGWAVLGVAIVLGLFFLVPFGLERSSAVVPTTSADPVPQTPGPQTWVLSSTVVIPRPATGDAEPGPDLDDAAINGDTGDDSVSMIIRIPVAAPTAGPGTVAPTATQHSAAPSTTALLPSTTTPATVSTCPQSTASGLAPRLAEKLGGELGSTSDTGGDCTG